MLHVLYSHHMVQYITVRIIYIVAFGLATALQIINYFSYRPIFLTFLFSPHIRCTIWSSASNSDSCQIGHFYANGIFQQVLSHLLCNVGCMQISHFPPVSRSGLSRNNRLAVARTPSVLVLRRLDRRAARSTRVQPLLVPVNQMRVRVWVRVRRADL
jgi:hypothetical protein